MLPSNKIEKGFNAICEEAEKLQQLELSEEVQSGLKTIVLIAKHQSDIRGLDASHCCHGHKGGCHQE